MHLVIAGALLLMLVVAGGVAYLGAKDPSVDGRG